MPQFTNDVPDDSTRIALPIRRTPSAGRLIATVTSLDLIGCDTHFYGGHTVPCEKPECEPCGKGVPFRWHCYMGALDYRTHLHFIFECTASAARSFIDYRNAHHELRGCLFDAQRLHSRPNGRVIIRTKPGDLEAIRLPSPPDLVACMAVIWQLPSPEVTMAGRLMGMGRIATVDPDPRGNSQNRTRKPYPNGPHDPTADPPVGLQSDG